MALSPISTHEVHLVPTFHWDREWFLPFEGFRARLIGAIDVVLELLEGHQAYRFTLDGQSILVDDYLELRPERREALAAAVAAGRLRVGPWYVQPDEYLVCGESLVRNLALGIRRAEELGGALAVGYVPDSFGHVADLPEILAGFGIDCALFARGLDGGAERLGDLFWWRAPSGRRALAHWMPEGYGPAAGLPPDEPTALAMLAGIRDRLTARASGPAVLLQAGSDHSRPQLHLPALVAAWARAGAAVRFSDHQAFFDAVRVGAAGRPEATGELRGSRHHPLLPGVLSSRIYLKLRNFELEGRLLREAEPAAALAAHLGAPDQALEPLLGQAWRHLLQNHPHDSICGCSVDAVHREMELRFDRCEQLADFVVDRGASAIGEALAPLPAGGAGDVGAPAVLLAINPEGQRLESSLVEATLVLSRAELAGPLEVVAGAAGEVQGTLRAPRPVQLLEQQSALQGVIAGPVEGLPQWLEQLGDRHPVRAFSARLDGETIRVEVDEGPPTRAARRIAEEVLSLAVEGGARRAEIAIHRSEARAVVDLTDLPPLGYAACALGRAACSGSAGSASGALEVSERGLRNERVELEVDEEGTIALRLAELDWRLDRLHRLEDVADRGDSYNHGALAGDRPVGARLAAVRVVERGPLRAALELRYVLSLPASLAAGREARAAELVEQPVTTRVMLWRDSARIDFVTTFSNRARDHRLRVRFPLPASLAAATPVVDGPFSVVERPAVAAAARPADGEAEAPADGYPLRLFVDASDGQRGLALLGAGPAEYGLGGGDALSLTLVRAVGWLARDDVAERPGLAGPPYAVPGAQCLDRPLTLRYALLPHAGDHRAARVLQRARRHAFPPLVRVVPDGAGQAPPRGRLARLEPGYLTTALYRDDGGRTICRAVNASGGPLPPPAGAQLDLSGNPLAEPAAAVPPWGMVTVTLG